MTGEKQENIAERIAKDAVDGLLKRVGKQAQEEIKQEEVTIDPETQKKIIDRQIKMIADPDFKLQEMAKMAAADEMQRNMDRRSGSQAAATAGKTEARVLEDERKQKADEMVAESTRRMEQAKIIYNTCLESGGTPAACAKIVADVMDIKKDVSAPPATSLNELLTALTKLDELRAPKTNSELTKILETLTAKVQALEERKASSSEPVKKTFIYIKADGSVEEIDAGRPIILEPKPAGGGGAKSIEEIRETNRHDEEMEKMKTDAKYKDSVADTFSKIPANLTELAAAAIAEKGGQTHPNAPMEHMVCKSVDKDGKDEGCGKDIPYKPDATFIQCPWCGITYQRTQKQ